MAILYLIEQNSILRKRGERLLVCRRPPASRRYSAVLQKDIIRDFPAADVDHVMLFGNIQVTTAAMHSMLRNGIEMAVFTSGGKLMGQLTPPMGKNIPLRISQFRRYEDSQFVLEFSRQIVKAKIANAQTLLTQFRANHPTVFTPSDLKFFKQMLSRAERCENLETLRGIEGSAAAHYFGLFGKLFEQPGMFAGRTRRPPQDPVNAVLSFGYVVTGSQIQWFLDGVGLDPYLGFFHAIDYGRPSLALDMLEEFRHSFVDSLAVKLFNQRILKESDFYHPPGGGVYLNTRGKQKFFTHYQKMLGEISLLHVDQSPEDFPVESKGYLSLFQRQVHRLIRTIQEGVPYRPFVIEK